MFVVEWFSKASGYSTVITSSLDTAKLIKYTMENTHHFTVKIRQIGNGATGVVLE